jgi:MFS family permease
MMAAEGPGGVAWAAIGLPYLTGFFLLLHASSVQISLLSAIPAICSLAGVAAVVMMDRLKGKKAVIVWGIVIFYLGHAMLGLLPTIAPWLPSKVQILVGLGLLAIAYIVVRIHEVFWYPLASAIVPEGQRAKFFGLLIVVNTLVSMPLSLIVGKFLDAHNTLLCFGAVFGVCGVIGSLAAAFYAPVPDVPNERVGDADFLLERLKSPFLDGAFRRFLVFVLFATLAGGLCGPFTNVFMIETLRIPYIHIAGFNALYSATYVVFLNVWGYIIDKYGNKPVLLLCASPLPVIQCLWVFNTPQHYPLIALIYLFNGIAVAGTVVAINNLLMGVSTGKNSASCLAAYQVVTGVVGFVAPLAGSLLVQTVASVKFQVWGMEWGQYHLLFLATGALLLVPLFLVGRIPETKGKSALFVLRNMMFVNPVRLAFNLFTFHRSESEQDRIHATTRLGQTANPLVLSELVNALDDPVYFVRREAALALGRVRDPDAVQPLIAKLADDYACIQHEAAWALGVIKDEASIQPLLECLKSPDRRLRGYAAMALGEIGASVAIDPLLAMLEKSNDVFENTCAANALSQLGYKKAVWKTLEKLVASDQAVVRRQLSVSLGDLLGDRGTFYRLLTKEEKVYGEAVGRLIEEMSRAIHKSWRGKMGDEDVFQVTDGLKTVQSLYLDGQYVDSLRQVVKVSDLLFGKEVHHYNYTQEIGRKFLRELLAQNEAIGNRVYWEECLLSIYELDLIFRATSV